MITYETPRAAKIGAGDSPVSGPPFVPEMSWAAKATFESFLGAKRPICGADGAKMIATFVDATSRFASEKRNNRITERYLSNERICPRYQLAVLIRRDTVEHLGRALENHVEPHAVAIP